MNIKIVADSSANLHTIESGIAFESVPLSIITDEREFVDNAELDIKEMVEYLSRYNGKSGTSCPSVADYLNAFGDAENIICITITGTLSGSYNAACVAKSDYETEHPDRHVYVIDSLSAGPELKLIIERAEKLILQGKDFDAICEELSEYKKSTGLFFVLQSLKNLANNGRVSPLIAKVAGVLGMRIVGIASERGDLQPMDKPRGDKKAMQKTFERMVELGYSGGAVRIDHCYAGDVANELKSLIESHYPKADVVIEQAYGLCSFYAENGGLMVGYEK